MPEMQDLSAPPEIDFGTITIRSVTSDLLELMYNHKIYYLKPGERWTLDKEIGRLLANKHFRQLEVVGEDEPLTVPPSRAPNKGKTYRDMNPLASKEKGKPWCRECGRSFTSSGQLMMHEKKHTAESRRREAAKAAEEAAAVDESKLDAPEGEEEKSDG